MRVWLVVMLLFSTAANAQNMCTVFSGSVPPCMVGTWIGQSDMAERLDSVLAALPEDVRARAREGSGGSLFIRIESDGWFVTSTLSAGADVTFFSDTGASEEMEISLRTTGGTGYFTAGVGDALAFCSDTGGFGIATMNGEPIPVVPDATPMPDVPMRQTCAGDAMQMFVDLPPPMGTVTYDLARVPEADIPPELREMLPER